MVIKTLILLFTGKLAADGNTSTELPTAANATTPGPNVTTPDITIDNSTTNLVT